ncbi:hypothetical protein J6590_063566 [Homalodisca vitripennis]|nr:hypothetical protein J6590_063566 [Homalodisca vitripennis]
MQKKLQPLWGPCSSAQRQSTQLFSARVQRFAQDWELDHITSSPHYSQSKAEVSKKKLEDYSWKRGKAVSSRRNRSYEGEDGEYRAVYVRNESVMKPRIPEPAMSSKARLDDSELVPQTAESRRQSSYGQIAQVESIVGDQSLTAPLRKVNTELLSLPRRKSRYPPRRVFYL